MPEGWYEELMGGKKAKELREKAAKLCGLTVVELTGRKGSSKEKKK